MSASVVQSAVVGSAQPVVGSSPEDVPYQTQAIPSKVSGLLAARAAVSTSS